MSSPSSVLRISTALAAALVLHLGSMAAHAQSSVPAEWEQADVVSVNREPMKASFFNFESRDLAL
ncbi:MULTISPECIES: hypothetical protein, partial [Asticcacaulis]|uniref:hypothetical protein n=1 Tax=Asticcacaulis TaxID=76890 RepID=UPI001AE5A71A